MKNVPKGARLSTKVEKMRRDRANKRVRLMAIEVALAIIYFTWLTLFLVK